MNLNKVYNLLNSYRSNDWRKSFVPFILGCVAIWIFYFQIQFDISSFILYLLSILTTIGFAALGYFINEYYDIEFDKKAGKKNRLSFLSSKQQYMLLIAASLLTLLPWFWLPSNYWSWIFISVQIVAYFLYSHPIIRGKEIPFFSNFLDAIYAYTLPAILAHYTYARYSGIKINEPLLILFLFALFLIGFRNILVHQIKDMFYDKIVEIRTLPMILGVKKTHYLIILLQIAEVVLFSFFLFILSKRYFVFTIFLCLYILSLFIMQVVFLLKEKYTFYTINSGSLIPNKFYHVYFPIIAFSLMIYYDYRWIIALPFIIPFINFGFMRVIFGFYLKIFSSLRVKVIHAYYRCTHYFGYVKLAINYLIFYFFLLFKINLKEKKMSALQYLKSLFS